MQRSTNKRSVLRSAIGVVSVTGLAGLSLVGLGASPALATDSCGEVTIENSTDGGATWSTTGRYTGGAPTTISVRLTGNITEGCEYPVSLASYNAEGPSWETSGTQSFLGWDTTVLSSETPEDTLDVSAYVPTCFGQIDLYGNGTKYDGTEGNGALPHYPNSPTPQNLIAAWNGESPCEPETPTEPPTDEPTEPTEEPPTDEPTDEPTEEAPSEEPTDEPTEEAPETPVTPVPVPDTDLGGEVPVGEPIVLPVSETPDLAETGGNGSQLTLFASVGAGLLVLGGGAAFFAKRRGGSNTPA
ncbi:hypothetical protein [Streptomyces avicenniae]|uniref:hypothetical protein n=1 Tax=Streptomyces avicenniae TaxID=500153 RepID=UPI00069A5774|nr:hypothetical protein [Streptomyces avicenniae]